LAKVLNQEIHFKLTFFVQWHDLFDYISDNYPIFYTNPHGTSIYIRIECKAVNYLI